jgi:hypothetical protein
MASPRTEAAGATECGRVEIVHHEEEPLLARGLVQKAPDGVEEGEARALGVDGSPCCSVARSAGEALEIASQLPHDLDPRPVGRGAALLPAARHEHTPVGDGGRLCERLHEAGLADPRLAGDEDERATACSGFRERITQVLQLFGAADERPYRRSRRGLAHLSDSVVPSGGPVQPRFGGGKRPSLRPWDRL